MWKPALTSTLPSGATAMLVRWKCPEGSRARLRSFPSAERITISPIEESTTNSPCSSGAMATKRCIGSPGTRRIGGGGKNGAMSSSRLGSGVFSSGSMRKTIGPV